MKKGLTRGLVTAGVALFAVAALAACGSKTSDKKSAQLVFCDLSTPHNDGKFNVYDDLKKKLIDKGIPEEEIAFIHDADTEVKKNIITDYIKGGFRYIPGEIKKEYMSCLKKLDDTLGKESPTRKMNTKALSKAGF